MDKKSLLAGLLLSLLSAILFLKYRKVKTDLKIEEIRNKLESHFNSLDEEIKEYETFKESIDGLNQDYKDTKNEKAKEEINSKPVDEILHDINRGH